METEEKKSAKEKAKELWEKLKSAVGKVSKVVWIIVAAVILAIIIGIVIFVNTRPYSVLITGATNDEVTTVTNWLEARGVRDYRVQGNGTVTVPERRAVPLKAALLTEMYSDGGGTDYSMYFENVSMLSTESERNNALKFALEEKMNSVIGAMDGVQFAEVTIAPGEDRTYVLDSNNMEAASASVFVYLRDGKMLSENVASAIRGYVSGGVQGLEIDAVDLYDNLGNHYYGSDGTASLGGNYSASEWKFALEQKEQNKIRTEIMNALIPLFGEDNVRAAVNVSLAVDTTDVTEEEHYIPEELGEDYRESGHGVIGSRAGSYTYLAPGEAGVGGLVGSEPNSDVSTDVEAGITTDDVSNRVQGDWQTDYENSTRTTRTYRDTAYVSDVHVALTVNSKTAEELNLENLRQTVANAAGINAIQTENMTPAEYLASKVSIYAGPFYEPEPIIVDHFAWWPFDDIIPGEYIVIGAAALLLLIILIVIIVLLAKRHAKKKAAAAALAEEEAQRIALEEAEQERQAAEAALAEAMGMPQTELVGADVMSLQTEKSMELRQDIRQFVEENPEVAAQLLKNWLRGGEEHG